MRTKLIKIALGALCAITAMFPAVSVLANAEGNSVETINNIGMGNVSITLNEYKVDAAGNKVLNNSESKIVLPGEAISKYSEITVNAHKSLIRAKVMVSGDKEIVDLNESWVRLVEDKNWSRIGEYWYYTEPVDHGKTIAFTKDIIIPTSEDNVVQNKNFNVVIWVDAVQYDNFKPNFRSNDPWFGTVIETSVYDTYRNKESESAGLAVFYEGGAQGLIANTGDVFKNFKTLMPGDTVSDKLVIGSSYANPVRLFFRIDKIDNEALAKQVELTIKAGEVPIFNGTLASAMNEVYLAYMTQGYQAVLTFELKVPEELKNDYALTDAKQKWVFRADLGGDPTKSRIISRNTSDPTNTAMYMVICGVAVAVCAGAAVYVIRRRKDEDSDSESATKE